MKMRTLFDGLQGRLLLIQAVPVVGIIIVLLVGVLSLRGLSGNLREEVTVDTPMAEHMGEMQVSLNAITRIIFETYTTETTKADERNRQLAAAREQIKSFEKAHAEFLKLPKPIQVSEIFKTVEELWPKVLSITSEILVQLEKNGFMENEKAKNIAVLRLRPETVPLLSAINRTAEVRRQIGQEQAQKHLKDAYSSEWIMLIGGVLITIFALVLGRIVSSRLVGNLSAAIQKLDSETNQTRNSANNVAKSSQILAQSATEQAAALQETSASVDEMNAMVGKNADNAAKSGSAASQSLGVANKGKTAAQEMLSAIREINDSNAKIMKQVEASNARISEIGKVITDIGNKTKIINDIVFQTKLLSFNASVEAARAGEQGKGFAVVAEEVGNLAQVSGNAAKEIESMLASSVQKVDAIVTDTKSQVEGLLAEGRQKVSTGSRIAEETSSVLEEILAQVSSVDGMIKEISTASREQAQGIQEISKAMNQLDHVTQQNSSVSNQIATAAGEMSARSDTLAQVVNDLRALVWGGSHASGNPAPTPTDQI